MLSFLEGEVVSSSGPLVLSCFGIGFEINMPERDLSALRVGSRERVQVLLHVSPDGPKLYGFASQGEKAVFALLLKVPGIGPKAASRLISSLEDADLGPAEGGAPLADDGVVEALENLGWKGPQALAAYRSAKAAFPNADSSRLLKACLQILDRHA